MEIVEGCWPQKGHSEREVFVTKPARIELPLAATVMRRVMPVTERQSIVWMPFISTFPGDVLTVDNVMLVYW